MLGLEAETAFNQLPTSEQNILKQMKEKLLSIDVIISKAAKGNCIVNTYQYTHHDKIMEFINKNNNFINIKGDLLKKFQTELRNNIIKCPHIIHEDVNGNT